MNNWLEWGIPIIEWLQNLGEGLLTPMKFFSFLGTEDFFMFVMPALLWCYDASLGFRVGFALLVSNGVNAMFKVLVGWPRPFWVSGKVKALSTEVSYGTPSGHAQNAVVLWGRLAAAFRRPVVLAICIIIILLISVSRLYLGMHFPTDVLAGWIVGGSLLAVLIVADHPVSRWLEKQSMRNQMVAACIVPLIILLLGLLVVLTVDQTIPQEWVVMAQSALQETEAIDPFNPEGLISVTGSLLGLNTGFVLLQAWGRFNAGGTLLKRVLRFLLGVIGVAILFFGLRMLFPAGNSILAYILRFFRYAVVGFWVSYLAPRLFVLTKLA
jgi:membrane-associated phospholipid phosphatase